MTTQKDAGLWIRLSHVEREEIEQESNVSGHNMSEVARQRLFNDPVARIDRRLDTSDRRMATLERRSLSQVAVGNLIIELIESLFPKEHRIGKRAIQERLDELKLLVIKAENAAMNAKPETE